MKPFRFLFAVAFALTLTPLLAQTRERLDFDADWKFFRNDPSDLKGELDYNTVKPFLFSQKTDIEIDRGPIRVTGEPGGDVPATTPSFDDSSWRAVTLPHDWAIEGPFDINLPGETGKLPYEGVGWYRKHFTLPSSDEGRRISIEFDGAMSYSLIWVNGHFVGGWPYGYSSFAFDITPYVKIGGENVISVRLNNPRDSSRWYPGAGIYRDVWLTKTSPVHVKHWGTYVTTPDVSDDAATVDLKTTIQNDSDKPEQVTLAATICEWANGKPGAPVLSFPSVTVQAPNAGALQEIDTKTKMEHPKLWDTTHPNLREK